MAVIKNSPFESRYGFKSKNFTVDDQGNINASSLTLIQSDAGLASDFTITENVTKTLELISNVEIASKEQLLGIEQINDAVNQLDQQTQENVSVSNIVQDIAKQTDGIATLIVDNANEKEFIGKDDIVSEK